MGKKELADFFAKYKFCTHSLIGYMNRVQPMSALRKGQAQFVKKHRGEGELKLDVDEVYTDELI